MTRILSCHTAAAISQSFFTIWPTVAVISPSATTVFSVAKKRSKEKYGAALKSFRLIEGQSDNCRESDEHWQPWR